MVLSVDNEYKERYTKFLDNPDKANRAFVVDLYYSYSAALRRIARLEGQLRQMGAETDEGY